MVWNPVTHITDQFKKPSVDDFPDTYQPLSESRRLSSIGGGEGLGGFDEKKGIPGESSPSGSLSDDEKRMGRDPEKGGNGPMTLAKMREDLDNEAAAFGMSSMYDRK